MMTLDTKKSILRSISRKYGRIANSLGHSSVDADDFFFIGLGYVLNDTGIGLRKAKCRMIDQLRKTVGDRRYGPYRVNVPGDSLAEISYPNSSRYDDAKEMVLDIAEDVLTNKQLYVVNALLQGRTLTEIGNELGTTTQNICNVSKSAIRRIRHRLGVREVNGELN
ncbi:hypothetical protein MLD52_09155 [Puniceicoccaceae bacterium K14]|nr:hypothetical protein [Puniceicoccaceae bacterium K14]